MKEMLDEAFRAGGNVAGAARHIQVTPWTIKRWMLRNGYHINATAELVPARVRSEKESA